MSSQQQASVTSISNRCIKTSCSVGVAGIKLVAAPSKESEVDPEIDRVAEIDRSASNIGRLDRSTRL